MGLHDDGEGGYLTNGSIATLILSNTRQEAVTLTHIEPIADRGLEVSYMGHTTCFGGCVGTGYWDDPTVPPIVQRVQGKYPVSIPVDRAAEAKPEHLVFLLRVTPSAIEQLRTGCLWLRALRVTFADGHRGIIDGWGDRTILGVFADDHYLPAAVHPGVQRCALEPGHSP
jgi:hypothetical protein